MGISGSGAEDRCRSHRDEWDIGRYNKPLL